MKQGTVVTYSNASGNNERTYGGSALGIAQNMAAPNAPAALKGQIVSVAFSDYYHQAAYQGGVWRKELLEGWLTSTGMREVIRPRPATCGARPTHGRPPPSRHGSICTATARSVKEAGGRWGMDLSV
jgi:predicted acyl esterase